MSKLANVQMFSDNVERYVESMTGARLWGEQVHLIVQGNEQANQVRLLDADEIIMLEATSGLQRVGNFAETIAALIQEHTGLLLMPATKRAKSLDARLSIQLNAAVVDNATSVAPGDDSLFTEHRMYGSLAFGKEKIKITQVVITLTPGALEPVETNASHTYPIVPVPYITPHHGIMCQECRIKSVSSIDLSKARRVVGVGRGLVAQNDLEMVRQLTPILGAEVGRPRPIAEGENWIERKRYIGVSGVLLKPDLYPTLGISGQIQHMVGGSDTEIIVAINKGKRALISNYADYGLVGNIYKVVPILIEHLNC